MSCFPCFSSQKSKKSTSKREHVEFPPPDNGLGLQPVPETKKQKPQAERNNKEENNQPENANIAAQTFTFRDLATATKNFRQECLLGEGGFGRVYKGTIQGTGQVVAVKQLDRTGLQGNKEFLVEVLMLTSLHHPNLVNLLGYCADGDQRLLVYEYLSGGSLEDHLLDIMPEQKPLDWSTRMRIAYGAAQGLEYLHDKANPPVIYRDLKSSNILLDDDFNPKLSDFGLAKLGPMGENMHVSSRVVGTYGYCAPEYARTGHLTMKSDVYSFGVVLLELITGRRAIDTTKPIDEQNLVSWAQPLFRNPKRFPEMADPLLNRLFSETGLNQAVAVAAMCLQEEASARPLMSDIVSTLSFLSMVQQESITPSPLPTPPTKVKSMKEGNIDDGDSSSDGESDTSEVENENLTDEGSSDDNEDNENENRLSVSSSGKGSMRSQDSSVFSGYGISRKSCDRSISTCKSSRKSRKESDSFGRLSSMESENGVASSERNDSMGSDEESVTSEHRHIMRSEDESVYF